MRIAISEVGRVLDKGGKAIYVVGEHSMRGTYIRNSIVVFQLADLAGLTLEKRSTRNLPPKSPLYAATSCKGRHAGWENEARGNPDLHEIGQSTNLRDQSSEVGQNPGNESRANGARPPEVTDGSGASVHLLGSKSPVMSI